MKQVKQTIACGAAAAIGAVAAFAAYSAPGAAQSEPFLRGNQVSLIIGYGPAGGYDTHARFLARFMGKHLSGQPAIVPRNMPVASSLAAANHIYNVALVQVLGQEREWVTEGGPVRRYSDLEEGLRDWIWSTFVAECAKRGNAPAAPEMAEA